jgi:hypothetical protein
MYLSSFLSLIPFYPAWEMVKQKFIEERLALKKAGEAIGPHLTVTLLMHELLRYVVSHLPY